MNTLLWITVCFLFVSGGKSHSNTILFIVFNCISYDCVVLQLRLCSVMYASRLKVVKIVHPRKRSKLQPNFSVIVVIFLKDKDILTVGKCSMKSQLPRVLCFLQEILSVSSSLNLSKYFKGGIEVRIVRECGYLNTTINSCKKTGMNVVEQVLCSCDEDGCNFSSQLKPKMILVVLLMFSTFSTLLL